MSKTTQENIAKKAKKLAVEEQRVDQSDAQNPIDPARIAVDQVNPVEPSTESNITDSEVITPESQAAQKVDTDAALKKLRVRSKRYLAARKKVDANKLYSLKDAVELVKETSLTKFDGKVEAHLTVTEEGSLGEIAFPHLDLGAKKIVILNDSVLAEIKDGKINFDILIATPVTMPKLLPFARTLGPRGLMPNPKSGTLTDKPEEAVKKLSVAKTPLKTEKKAKVIHLVVGKVSQPAQELVANVTELIRVIRPQRLKKLVLTSTMGPGIKVAFEK
jgi:large subunit ribosomal protein L1